MPRLSETFRCSTCLPIDFLAVRWHSTADHKWTMLAKFNVVAYGDGDGGAGSGIRIRVTSLEDWCINPYTMPA